jgi:hypothetical protein
MSPGAGDNKVSKFVRGVNAPIGVYEDEGLATVHDPFLIVAWATSKNSA